MAHVSETMAILAGLGHVWSLTAAAVLLVAIAVMIFGVVSGLRPATATVVATAVISLGIVLLCAATATSMAIATAKTIAFLALAVLGLYAIVVSLIGGVIGWTGLTVLHAAGAGGGR